VASDAFVHEKTDKTERNDGMAQRPRSAMLREERQKPQEGRFGRGQPLLDRHCWSSSNHQTKPNPK
jgi:hypothetical protein